MPAGRKGPPPRYSRRAVERAIVEVVAGGHPERLQEEDLKSRVVTDCDDRRELEVFAQALRSLAEFGLIRIQGDDIVAPAPALVAMVALFDFP